MLLGESLKYAAAHYFKAGIVAMPLKHDANGLPKRPFVDGWQTLTLDAQRIGSLPWSEALGLGIVLGPASGNLGVIDIDDEGLAQTVFALTTNVAGREVPFHERTRCVSTARKRGHVYFIEEEPSHSTRFDITWQGRKVGIELKAKGTQVAAPPTPGYGFVSRSYQEIMRVQSLSAAWQAISYKLGIQQQAPATSGYPRPWQPYVPAGQRNNALYVEACRLKEAGMPEQQALDIIAARLNHYAQGGMSWREVERTVRSAYQRMSQPDRAPIQRRFWGAVAV